MHRVRHGPTWPRDRWILPVPRANARGGAVQLPCNKRDVWSDAQDVAAIVAADRGSKIFHAADDKTTAWVTNDAANRGDGRLLVIPPVLQQIQVRDIGTARQSFE